MPNPRLDRTADAWLTHVALLRGINVGGNHQVPMPRLKALFESLGHAGVTTYINSGNVLFGAEGAVEAPAVEAAFEAEFGFPAPILLREKPALLAVADAIPEDWRNDSEQRTEVMFLWDDYHGAEALDLLPVREGVDSVLYASGAVVWNYRREDRGRTGLARLPSSKLYRHMTARNVNTLRRLVELLTAHP